MKSFIVKSWPLLFILAVVIFFFRPFIFDGKLPIPSDTIAGLYHPFRDLYVKDYPRGVPFKNFLITDPVRQQYPWRELAIDLMKNGQWPLWNPYSFSGMPLLANLQSAVFYPLNFLFLIFPFNFTWSFLIFIEPLLAGIFLYHFLRNLSLDKTACLLGGISFSFSGFFISWLEWGTIIHAALWLPLILLAIDKIIFSFAHSKQTNIIEDSIRRAVRRSIIWPVIFIFSLTSSFLAGHLQTFFYVMAASFVYLIIRWRQYGKNIKIILLFLIGYLVIISLTAVQWFPAIQLINLSGRNLDQINWQKEGWFIPWQNIVQFFAPDFFGNSATLNYWGVWNYGEFIGYIGILPLILAVYALVWRQDKKTLFFGTLFFLSLFFSFPTLLAKIPYQLQIPFFSSSQPTRLLFLIDFSLACLAALGMDVLQKQRQTGKRITVILTFVVLVFLTLWFLVLFGSRIWSDHDLIANFAISKRNLILPTGLLVISALLIWALTLRTMPKKAVIAAMLFLVVFDLTHFGQKFIPFNKSSWLFPKTRTIEYLNQQEKPYRIMSTDRRILPPNFSVVYRLESVEGYDPLYLSRYAELIAASERYKPNIMPPLGFNRIITPANFESPIIDLLNVKYVLSLNDLNSQKLKKVFQEGQTQVYENLNVLPRLFFVEKIKKATNKQEAISEMFLNDFDPRKTAIVETNRTDLPQSFPECKKCTVKITSYEPNQITAETENENNGFLVIANTFYPSWKVKIDNSFGEIFRVDYNFQGVLIPKGKHTISLTYSLWP